MGGTEGSDVRVYSPRTLEQPAALGFCSEVRSYADTPGVLTIDFSKLNFARPFGALVSGLVIRDVAERRTANGFETRVAEYANNQACSYLQHVGFFQLAGFDLGKDPGEAAGSARYMPLTFVRRSELVGDELIQNVIEARCEQLSEVLAPPDAYGEMVMLQYCLREIVRNVFEHSGADDCVLMAQRYARGDAEIAIADSGCGIAETLREHYDIDSDATALRYAIQPGVSGSIGKDNSGPWGNSGFGLFVLSSLGKTYGQFIVGSGDAVMTLSKSEDVRAFEWNGTLLCLNLKMADVDYFPNILGAIVEDGQQDAAKHDDRISSASSSGRVPSRE